VDAATQAATNAIPASAGNFGGAIPAFVATSAPALATDTASNVGDLSAQDAALFGEGSNFINDVNPQNFSGPPALPTNADTGSFWKDAKGIASDVAPYLKTIAPLAGLAYSATKNNTPTAYPQYNTLSADVNAQKANASNLQNIGNSLLQPLLTGGNLPGGAQTILDTNTQAQIAQVKQKFASMGLSGSTMEQQEINSIQNSAAQTKMQQATNFAQAGLSTLGASNATLAGADSQLAQLLNMNVSNNSALQGAIAKYITSLAGGGVGSAQPTGG
jgi:hypothetical protein